MDNSMIFLIVIGLVLFVMLFVFLGLITLVCQRPRYHPIRDLESSAWGIRGTPLSRQPPHSSAEAGDGSISKPLPRKPPPSTNAKPSFSQRRPPESGLKPENSQTRTNFGYPPEPLPLRSEVPFVLSPRPAPPVAIRLKGGKVPHSQITQLQAKQPEPPIEEHRK